MIRSFSRVHRAAERHTVRVAEYRIDVPAASLLGQLPAPEEVGRGSDDGEEIVEVVRDAAGELADSFHVLCLPEPSSASRRSVMSIASGRTPETLPSRSNIGRIAKSK